MEKAYINSISYVLPDKLVTNADLNEEFPEWSIEKIGNKIGINERHIAGANEFSSDLAIKAADLLISENNIDKENIDFILLCTQSPDYFLPTTACLVQEALGLNTNVGAVDFNLGCSGYIYGLAFAKGLIAGGIAKNIILITAETYSKFLHPNDKGNRTIFGDAATATLISTIGKFEIKNFELGSDGKGAENLIVKTGGMRNRKPSNLEIYDEFGNINAEDYLFMNGPAIFNFTSEAVPKLINQTLEKNNKILPDIDLFIFHQANNYMLQHLRRKIGIEDAKFYVSMDKVGNTVSSTIPIALKNAISENKITENQDIILAGFGVGYSWGAVLIST